MKKSVKTVAKVLLKAALLVAGFAAFIFVVGEPTEEWIARSRELFGSFAGIWCFIEKTIAALLIAVLIKVWLWIEPDALKEIR